MIHIPTFKKRFFEISMFLFFFYLSIYGSLIIFQGNSIVRLSKDILLAWFVFISLIWLLFNKKYPLNYMLLTIVGLLSTMLAVGMFSLSNGNTIITFGYGIKITLLPMGAIVFGVYLKNKKYNMHKVFLIVFISLITGWVIQWNMGIDRLIQMGFEYGVNVKHFKGGIPRLPSIVGTPDGYAFMLAIFGLFLELSYLGKNRKKLAFAVKVLTLTFLFLATLRSALMLFLICQFVTYFEKVKIVKGRVKLLYYSLSFFLLSLFTLSIPFIISSNLVLLNTYSLLDRFNHWMSFIPSLSSQEGYIGLGLGVVGSASKRIADLGYYSTDYAVDNQYIAIFQQLGLLGAILYLLFFAVIFFGLFTLRKKVSQRNKNIEDIRNLRLAMGLILAISASSIFTNIIEVYPFNLFLFVFLGMQLHQTFYVESKLEAIQEVKKQNDSNVLYGNEDTF